MRNITMSVRVWIAGCAVLALAACADVQTTTDKMTTDDGFFKELPEGVRMVAAKNQDLTAVKIDPSNGCYVYRYRGPVETTFLPLRADNGRPICTQTIAAAAAG
jgi:hypothetical protein